MAFREQPSGGDASETFGSLVSRIRRQNGAANMKPRAHGVHSVRRHAPRISGVSSHRVGGGGSYQQEVPASSAGGGGSQCSESFEVVSEQNFVATFRLRPQIE